MSWIASWVAAHTTRLLQTRVCPECGHRESAPRSRDRESITCSHCGATIHPEYTRETNRQDSP